MAQDLQALEEEDAEHARNPRLRDSGFTSQHPDGEWIGFHGKILTGKPHEFNGKIYGFRVRFSLKPIH